MGRIFCAFIGAMKGGITRCGGRLKMHTHCGENCSACRIFRKHCRNFCKHCGFLSVKGTLFMQSVSKTNDERKSFGRHGAIKNNQYLCFVMVGSFRRHASIIMNSQEEFTRLLTQTALRPDGATATLGLHHRKTSGDMPSASLCQLACLTDFSFPLLLFAAKGNVASPGFPPLFRNYLCGSSSQLHNLTQDARIRTHRQDISRS